MWPHLHGQSHHKARWIHGEWTCAPLSDSGSVEECVAILKMPQWVELVSFPTG